MLVVGEHTSIWYFSRMAIFVTSSGFIIGRIDWRSVGSKAVCSPAWPAPSKPKYEDMLWASRLLEYAESQPQSLQHTVMILSQRFTR